ncbi:MarR family winged helix-turn-helix transcriptional regulator [Enemella sp. A6]|uniref:MarR family winged helix-turn-helix transcriptional regulator n=1 Tax=Enemella sp. A6 TaxID=3440152 RepID=UPI003EBE4C2E
MTSSAHTDEVDALVADWARERPDLDTTPLLVFSRITRIAVLLDRARQSSFADHGLSGWEFDVLAALRRSGAPYRLTPGQLLRETMVTSGTMTTRVDRLTERGLVERLPDPSDRRGVLVAMTDKGRQVVDGALGELLAVEDEMLADLSPEDRQHLADLLRRLGTAFD